MTLEVLSLPKRARCPYCDRHFDRRVLDDHIQRCRYREKPEKRLKVRSRRNLVVDGNNVAHFLSSNNTPRAANLARAIRSLSAAGYKPVVVVSAALKHKIDKPMTLQNLQTEGFLIEAPRGTNDDLTIIEEAKKRNADIVSNDRFLDWQERHPWIASRLRRYRMTHSGLILS